MKMHLTSMVKNNNDGLFHPVPDSTELIIQRAIDGIQKMIRPYESKEGETPQVAVIEINPAMKKHWETEIKILRDAPRDPHKLRQILKAKPPTWNAIRMACRRRNIHMDMRLCRKIHGSWLHKQGISTEEVDFLQGRVSPSVFGRHYLTPDSTLRQRVLVAVSQLEKEIK